MSDNKILTKRYSCIGQNILQYLILSVVLCIFILWMSLPSCLIISVFSSFEMFFNWLLFKTQNKYDCQRFYKFIRRIYIKMLLQWLLLFFSINHFVFVDALILICTLYLKYLKLSLNNESIKFMTLLTDLIASILF